MSTISQKIEVLIQNCVDRGLLQEEPIQYDVSMIATPGHGGQATPMIGLSFTIAAVALDQGHSAMLIVPPVVPTQDEMDNLIRRVVEQMRTVRTEAAQAQMQAKVRVGGPDGPEVPTTVQSPSGLIVPG